MGNGCGKCTGKTSDKNYFLDRSNEIHNNKYDYSLVEYIGVKNKIKIICPIHGEFKQTPSSHTKGNGCPKCSKSYNYTNSEYIEKVNKIHNNKYDYSLTNYINSITKIKIVCPIHGLFEIKPYTHMYGQGCKKCGILKRSLSQNEFIKRSISKHGNIYDYSKVKFKNTYTRVDIICTKHGLFSQNPYHHMIGVGCPKCKQSKGELMVRNYLENNNIGYIQQKKFINCFYIKELPFDFYLEDYNLCIEYDGEQHYKPNKHFGGEYTFNEIIKKDNIKNNFCKKEGINLLRIRYDENIEEKLNNYFKPSLFNI